MHQSSTLSGIQTSLSGVHLTYLVYNDRYLEYLHTLTEFNLISNNIRSTSIDNYLVDQSSMPRLPKNIVPVDPQRQPHIKKFVMDGRRVGISTVSGKTNNKAVPKKRRRRSTGETKGKSEKRRTVIHSESSFV